MIQSKAEDSELWFVKCNTISIGQSDHRDVVKKSGLRRILLEGVEQPKISPKTPGNAFSDALLMSRFQITRSRRNSMNLKRYSTQFYLRSRSIELILSCGERKSRAPEKRYILQILDNFLGFSKEICVHTFVPCKHNATGRCLHLIVFNAIEITVFGPMQEMCNGTVVAKDHIVYTTRFPIYPSLLYNLKLDTSSKFAKIQSIAVAQHALSSFCLGSRWGAQKIWSCFLRKLGRAFKKRRQGRSREEELQQAA